MPRLTLSCLALALALWATCADAVAGPPALSSSDRELLARLALAEAVGAGELGMAAVARSVLNRVALVRQGRAPGTHNAQSRPPRAILSAPLRHGERLLGAIYLDNRFKPDCFDEGSLELVGIVADHLALALENARLQEEKLRQKSEIENA